MECILIPIVVGSSGMNADWDGACEINFNWDSIMSPMTLTMLIKLAQRIYVK